MNQQAVDLTVAVQEMVATLLNLTGIESPSSPPADEKVTTYPSNQETNQNQPSVHFSGCPGRSQGSVEPSPPKPRRPDLLYDQRIPLKAVVADKEPC